MRLYWDCESYPIRDGLITPRLVCVSLATNVSEGVVHRADRGSSALEHWLLHETGPLVGHNVAYDFAVLGAYRPELIPAIFAAYRDGRVRCTKIRQQLLDIASGMRRIGGSLWVYRGGNWVAPDYSLAGNPEVKGSKGLVGYYTGKDRSAEKGPDTWRMRYYELDGLEASEYPKEAYDYAAADATDTRAVYLAQGPDALVNEVEQVRKAFALQLVSAWGMRTDQRVVTELEGIINSKYDYLQKRFLAEGLYKIGGTKKAPKVTKSMVAIRDRVQRAYDELGEPVPKTDKGAIKTDSDTLGNSGDPLLEELGDAGPVSTIRNTFLPTMRLGTERPINTRYNSLLETGRISSAKPNLNNLPRSLCWCEDPRKHDGDCIEAKGLGVREAFIPRPGFVYASVDYDCAELRSLAQVCLWLFGKSEMARFFQEDPNGDPHLAVAAGLLGISLEEAKRRINEPEIKDARQAAKALNYGFPGGLGIKKFTFMAKKNYGVVMDPAEAQHRKRQWLKRWPEMRRFFDYVSAKVKDGGAALMQLRPGQSPHRVRGEVGYCDGCNGYFQGLTADGAGDALWQTVYECYVDLGTPLFGCRPVAFLYDEIIVEVPEKNAHDAAFRLRDVMVEAMERWTPDVPATASPVLMRRWSKKAKELYENGRMVPWG